MDEKQRRQLPPSERAAADDQARVTAERRASARALSMHQDFTRTFRTESGKRVLQWLRQRCGHNKIILSANAQNGTIDQMMTTFAAMELNLYLEIRKHLPTDILKEIENDRSIEPSGSLADDDTGSGTSRRTERTRDKRRQRTVE